MAGHLFLDDVMTYAALVNGLEALTAQLRAAGCVFAEEEAAVLLDASADLDRAGDRGALADMVSRRIAGQPLEHVLGRVDFAGLPIQVGPGVFVPRRRSELLVTAALDLFGTGTPGRAHRSNRPLVLVELCCGVAAIATALTRALLDADRSPLEVHATDADPVAVRWAELNLDDVTRNDPARDDPTREDPDMPAALRYAHRGDLYDALPDRLRGCVDLLLAVPPYVPTSQLALMPAEARLHEPVAALDGGPDGLEVTRRIVAAAPGWLAPGGALLVETSPSQCDVVAAELTSAGLHTSVITCDEPEAVVVIGISQSSAAD